TCSHLATYGVTLSNPIVARAPADARDSNAGRGRARTRRKPVAGELRSIRTDVVGSLLRPQRWQQARQRLDDRTLTEDAFREIEFACVRELVDLQERIGLDVVTDGEISRLNFQDSFGLAVTG